jgi:hypothetical protein
MARDPHGPSRIQRRRRDHEGDARRSRRHSWIEAAPRRSRIEPRGHAARCRFDSDSRSTPNGPLRSAGAQTTTDGPLPRARAPEARRSVARLRTCACRARILFPSARPSCRAGVRALARGGVRSNGPRGARRDAPRVRPPAPGSWRGASARRPGGRRGFLVLSESQAENHHASRGINAFESIARRRRSRGRAVGRRNRSHAARGASVHIGRAGIRARGALCRTGRFRASADAEGLRHRETHGTAPIGFQLRVHSQREHDDIGVEVGCRARAPVQAAGRAARVVPPRRTGVRDSRSGDGAADPGGLAARARLWRRARKVRGGLRGTPGRVREDAR